jgi:hypothetical protein
MQQLKLLQDARDGMKQNSVSRDALSMIEHLKSYPTLSVSAVQPRRTQMQAN